MPTFLVTAAAIISFISTVANVDELTFFSSLIFGFAAFVQTITTLIYFALHYVDLGCDGLNKPLSDMPNAQALSGPPLMLMATVLSLLGALVMFKMPSSWSLPTATHGSIPGCIFNSIPPKTPIFDKLLVQTPTYSFLLSPAVLELWYTYARDSISLFKATKAKINIYVS